MQLQQTFNLEETQLESIDKYKYLGYLQNSKNNNDEQMKGRTEAAYQKMMALTGNSNFNQIEMETIWTVLEACIIPIITYSGEIWEVTARNYKTPNMIMDNILKRILKTPRGTPREALYIETGLLDPETLIMKNRITMEARIRKGNNETMKDIMELQHEGCWAMQNKQLKEKLQITEENLFESKYSLKKLIQQKIGDYFQNELINKAQGKSKMEYFLDGKQAWKVKERPSYLNKLTRNQASTIFKARTRMLKVKCNYKNGHRDLTCRACGKNEETQTHVLEECEKINEEERPVTKEMIFTENAVKLAEISKLITKRIEVVEKGNSTSS